jgi:uncharacterized protein YbjT (DUF2867 family)
MAAALIVGATGEVGSQLLEQALAGDTYDTIHLLLRRSIGYQDHPRVQEHIQDPLDPGSLQLEGLVTAVFCALGTTRKQAGSKAAFYHVDHDLVVAVGQWASDHGAGQLHVVSSIGANPRSPSHYVRTKGETERDLRRLQLPSLYLYRPGLLDAPDRAEFRLGERLAAAGLKALPLMQRWRPVSVSQAAAAMLQRALKPQRGCHVIESQQIQVDA